MDHRFTLALYGNPKLVDIVDQKWATEVLPFDDVQVLVDVKPIRDEDELEQESDYEQGNTEKWMEVVHFEGQKE